MESANKLEEWVEKSMCFRWLHRNSSYFYSQLDVIFSYLIITIGIFNALTTFICNNYFSLNENAKNTETFMVSSSSLAISAIAQLHRKAKFSEKSQQHAQASKLFEIYNRKLRNESIFDNKPDEKLKDYITEYDDIANSQPEIPFFIIKKFKRKYGHINIWKPNILYDIRDLEKRKKINKQNPIRLKMAFYDWLYITRSNRSTV
jgi:hypothetical protein